jgi:hypothetical protein
MGIRLRICLAIRKITIIKWESNFSLPALLNYLLLLLPRILPSSRRQRLAVGVPNTILAKPMNMISTSTRSFKSTISQSLRIGRKLKSSLSLGIMSIPILIFREVFTRKPK